MKKIKKTVKTFNKTRWQINEII